MSTPKGTPKLLKSSLTLKLGRGHLSDGFREQNKEMPVFFGRGHGHSGGNIYL